MPAVFPNRPMLFWEVMSAFRQHAAALHAVFSSDQWQSVYWKRYCEFSRLVKEQARFELDEVIPLEVTREICSRCEFEFYFSPSGHTLLVSRPAESTAVEVLSPLEVHERFGPAVIEEVFERGSARVA